VKNVGEPGFALRSGFDSLLTAELRFYIMTVLAMYQSAEFNVLKQQLEATDGNLSANLAKLEEAGYLTVKKEFVGKKSRSTYAATPLGLQRLSTHLETMTQIRNELKKEEKP